MTLPIFSTTNTPLTPRIGPRMGGLRQRINGWGATTAEQTRILPGEERLFNERIGSTQAITIDAPVEDVWPWLVQMGQGRGGFYSYSWLENLVGSNMRNADRIVPELQHLEEGQQIRVHPKAPPLTVTRCEQPRLLALEATASPAVPAWGWIFVLEPIGPTRTRLLSRTYDFPPPLPLNVRSRVNERIVRSLPFDFVHMVMGRRQMLSIKALAEGARQVVSASPSNS
jgi:hypothetical protein